MSTLRIFALLICMLLVLSPFGYIVAIYSMNHNTITRNDEYKPPVSTILYDRNNTVIAELYDENRRYVSFSEIPPVLTAAFLAAEDQNFYSHPGLDMSGIVRALFINIFEGTVRQGGSTITQQLAKLLYAGNARTYERKMIELFIARELEKKFTKNKILEMYLNQIYFGHGVYGVKSAADFFFNKKLPQLSAVEAAVLAGIPSAPSRYSPIKNPANAIYKNKQILFTMVQSGILTRTAASAQYISFWKEYLREISTRYPDLGIRSRTYDRAPHFTEYIRRLLVEKFGEKTVYRGGLRVYTTLDLKFQETARNLIARQAEKQQPAADAYNRYKIEQIQNAAAASALNKKKISRAERTLTMQFLKNINSTALASISELMGFSADYIWNIEEKNTVAANSALVQGALISIDPNKGDILAMIGGRSFEEKNQLNRTIQSMRQPGSAFKPFIYGAAIEDKKISAGTPFLDVPIVFQDQKKEWSPENYGKKFDGKILARRALAQSLNIVSVRIYDIAGGDAIAGFSAKTLNIPLKRITVDPTLALGSTEVSPLELAIGYGAIANGGYTVRPEALIKITDPAGKILFTPPQQQWKRAMSTETAFILTSMMQSVVDSGTARYAVRGESGFWHPAAGKTGTNTHYRDAWFAGFTPDMVTIVWFGCDSPQFALGSGQSGSAVAAPVWGKFMKAAHSDKKKYFALPRGTVQLYPICRHSGLKPGKHCTVIREYFIPGTQPSAVCEGKHESMKSIFDLAR